MKLSTHPLAQNMPAAAAPPLDAQLIQRLRASMGRLLAEGDRLAVTFYALLFERQPALRRMFPGDMTQQQGKLLSILAWVVQHLDRREQLLPALRELGSRHTGYGAKPEHYPIVRDTLVEAMARIAAPDWDESLAEDWRQSIDLLGRHMIGHG